MIEWLRDFYTQNETLAIALISLIGGALLTKLIPKFYEWTATFIIYVGKKIGGRFGFRSIQNKYLTCNQKRKYKKYDA